MTIGIDRLRWPVSAVGVLILLLLSGCSDIPGFDAVTNLISPSDEKRSEIGENQSGFIKYQIGDRYTFDNPVERWAVTAIDGDRVSWRNDTGERQVTGFNPMLPAREWQNRENGTGRRLIRDIKGDLFPMAVGESMSFRATTTSDRPPFGWEHNWTCRVDEKKTIDTLNGSFETFIVRCGHERPDEITYYYAPKVGHYVIRRTKQDGGKPDLVRNLLSFERADGSVVAGIVTKNSRGDGDAKNASAPVQSEISLKQNPKPVLQPAKPSVNASKNPAPGSVTNTPTNSVTASVVLATPKFGGSLKPPPPLKSASLSQTVRKPDGSGATSAPVASVRRAALLPAPPVAKRRVRKTLPRSKSSVSTRTGKTLQGLGPRASIISPPVIRPKTRVPVPPPPTINKVVSVPKPVAAPPSVPPPPKTRTSGSMSVHLASFSSETAAQEGWRELERAHRDLFKGLAPKIRRADVAGKGTYFRLYAAPLSPTSAETLCRELKGKGVFCTPSS